MLLTSSSELSSARAGSATTGAKSKHQERLESSLSDHRCLPGAEWTGGLLPVERDPESRAVHLEGRIRRILELVVDVAPHADQLAPAHRVAKTAVRLPGL